jgi:hypothetical protein
MAEMSPQLGIDKIAISRFAFPNDKNVPCHTFQLPLHTNVAFLVFPELAFPELDIRLRLICKPAAIVTVPETTMDEYYLLSPREH